ncbi:unnamed protein product, partial [marine sediment metagenome]
AGEITTEEAIEAINRLTIKVDGEEIEKELPFDLPPEAEEWMRKELQLAAASNKRMQEAAELKKTQTQREGELENFINQLKDPNELDAILKHFGHDPAKFAEDILNKEVENMKKTPEQLELEKLRAEISQRKDAEEKAKQSAEETKQRALEDKYAQDFNRDLSAALSKYELPDNPQMVREMSSLMRVALKQGIDVSFDEVGQIVKTQNDANIREVLKGLSADKLMEILKDNQINDIILKKAPKVKR